MTEQRKVYLARAGRNGEDEEYALDHGLAAIGFREFPSLADAKGRLLIQGNPWQQFEADG
jgi:hypothetical protein